MTATAASEPQGASGDALVTYLQGMRDAIDTVLRHMGAGRSATAFTEQPAFPQPFAQAVPIDPNFSWCLSLIGCRPATKWRRDRRHGRRARHGFRPNTV